MGVDMQAIWNLEINWILAIQTSLISLAGIMKSITFLGSEEFFILVMPILYWCVDAGAGFRIGVILLLSGHINGILKVVFHSPRPFWYSQEIKALSTETSFGLPSGHSMNTASIWGLAAYLFKKRWFVILSVVVIFLVGFSRLVLGMHFIRDVISGWVFGLLLLVVFIKIDQPVSRWVLSKKLSIQIWLVIITTAVIIVSGYFPILLAQGGQIPAEWMINAVSSNSAAIPQPYEVSGIFTTAGILLGFGIGAAWLGKRGGFGKAGNARNQLLRYVIGVVGIAVFWYGLGAIFPRGEEVIPLLLRLLRYSLVGLWISAGAPLIFRNLKLYTD
jgi:membrane-associated phospholipid phosphatase